MNAYHIWMMGPSRSGKTTLLASIIYDFKRISEEASRNDDCVLKLQAIGDTYSRINSRIDKIQAATYDGCFDTGCLEGTQDHEVFRVGLDYQKKAIPLFEPKFEMHFHDFPGGWLSQPEKIDKTNYNEAEVLIIPIDSSLVFEAVTAREKSSAATQLELASLKDTARIWANMRKEKKRGGLLLFVPVKCETYFNDHAKLGLQKDQSQALHDKLFSNQFFRPVKETIRDIYPEITAWYLPVDTVGCCYISRKKWIQSPEYGSELSLRYTIPSGAYWKPYGPANIMLHIIEYVISQQVSNNTWFDFLIDGLGWRTKLNENINRMKAVCKNTSIPYSRGYKLW